jgi:uridylate kinase
MPSTEPSAPAYRRVLLKISGEMLAGSQPFGIQADAIGRFEVPPHHQIGL